MKKYIAEIAIVKPLHNLFDYEIPSDHQEVSPGMRVTIEFGKKVVNGFVINIKESTELDPKRLKKILNVLDETPCINKELLDLFLWVSDYYHAPIGQIIGLGTPSYLRNGKEMLDVNFNEIYKRKDIKRRELELSREQLTAIEKISYSINEYHCFLLDGITGSGKTEVYKKVQEIVKKRDKQTLIIVPEKNLIPGLLQYFEDSKMNVLEYHSSLTPKKRFINWNLIQNCQADIIIGTRSSVFLKVPNLGLLIVDEEHDISLKNQSDAKYNARDIAIYRAKKNNIPIILGSATPSSETILNVLKKKYSHIKMRERINKKEIPSLKIIDMTKTKNEVLSGEVVKTIQDRLSKKEQVIIFLNRRGYSPLIYCKSCKWIPKCNQCGLNMTYHKKNKSLQCHHCFRNTQFHNKCMECNSDDISFIGEGTEKIEEVIKKEFSNSRIARVDSDSTSKKGQLQKIFEDIKSNKYDILVGTQMLSKGHHFPNVTLVVIMNIDQSLFSPRLKAIEQLAQQLIQVSGRAGRASKTGEVILQTAFPKNEDLLRLIKNGYENWVSNLLEVRKNLNLPPYKSWGVIQAKARKIYDAEKFLLKIKEKIISKDGVEVYGPMPSNMQKKANFYNLNLIIQSQTKSKLNSVLKDCIPTIKNIPYQNRIKWTIDIDPVDYD